MAITQVFSTPPTPPLSTDKTNFRTRYDAFLTYVQTLGATELQNFKTQVNALETNVNAKEVSCTASAVACTSAANFQGTWVNQLTVVGQSWAYNGVIYRVVVAGTASPITTPANWLSLGFGIGFNQTWQDVKASRTVGTIYTNSTGKPIMVTITAVNMTGNSDLQITINNMIAGCSANNGSGFTGVSALVPAGGNYKCISTVGSPLIQSWTELI